MHVKVLYTNTFTSRIAANYDIFIVYFILIGGKRQWEIIIVYLHVEFMISNGFELAKISSSLRHFDPEREHPAVFRLFGISN